ncbi:MAG: substrate-binding domain-containing protein [Oscillospiraceae bacterium]|jgi:ABC-type phosphate transport system substrate-binding protein|nr:substrate-binding domain-containing protein [Oscillospiraceae bacterium]
MRKLLCLVLLLPVLVSCTGTPAVSPSENPSPTPSPAASPVPTTAPPPEPLVFTEENFPRIDGSTATIPLAQTVYSSFLGKTWEQAGEMVDFNGTSQAWSWLYNKHTDLILAYEPPEQAFKNYTSGEGALEYAPIGRDALVFLVNAQNRADNLTAGQIRDIYTDKTTNWGDVGGDNADIVAYQRNESSGSQALMEKVVMGSVELADAPQALYIEQMGDLVDAVASYQNTQSAIGYNVYYYVSQMDVNANIKLLSVDGVKPTNESIQSGEYPFVNDFYAAIHSSEPENSPARMLYNWLQGAEGQRLVESAGYVPVSPTGGGKDIPDYEQQELQARFYEDFTETLLPRGDYGPIYPFIGALQGAPYGPFNPNLLYGLCTQNGEIVVDAVFHEAEIIERNGQKMYMLRRHYSDEYEESGGGTGRDHTDTTFAALDGSWAATYKDTSYDIQKKGRTDLSAPDSDYISVYDGAGWGAIDYAGNVVYPLKERNPVIFTEGLAAVWEDEISYWYVDINGKRVLGPYKAPSNEVWETERSSWYPKLHFSHGMALYTENGLWGYIDAKGNTAIKPRFESADPFYGDYAYIGPFWGESHITGTDIIDRKGELTEMRTSSSMLLENGWFYGHDPETDAWVLEKDGEVIHLDSGTVEAGLPGDRFLCYREIIDKEGNVLLSGWNNVYEMLPSGRVIVYIYESGASDYFVINSDYTGFLPVQGDRISEFGDCFAVLDGEYGGLTDIQGNWIVRVSLLDYFED